MFSFPSHDPIEAAEIEISYIAQDMG